MEFVEYLIALIALFLIIQKPQKERLAFSLILVCIVLDIALWIAASSAGWLPGLTL